MVRAGLYAILDLDALEARGIPVPIAAAAVLAARPAVLQLRAKSAPARVVLQLLRELVRPCRAAGTPLYANDRPDLALLAGADGVHVGQDDLPPDEVRRFAPGLAVGISTHDLEQLARALALRPDYVAFGPVFATQSKARPEPVVGLDGLGAAARLATAAGIPLVAIGGIDSERAAAVARHTPLAAVIAELFAAGSEPAAITAQAELLQGILHGD